MKNLLLLGLIFVSMILMGMEQEQPDDEDVNDLVDVLGGTTIIEKTESWEQKDSVKRLSELLELLPAPSSASITIAGQNIALIEDYTSLKEELSHKDFAKLVKVGYQFSKSPEGKSLLASHYEISELH